MSRGQGKPASKQMQAFTRPGPVATPPTERRGAQPTRVRCGAAASRRPSDAGTERCRSGTKSRELAANAALESRDAKRKKLEKEASVPDVRRKSSGLRLKKSRRRRKRTGYRRNWRRGQRDSSVGLRALLSWRGMPCWFRRASLVTPMLLRCRQRYNSWFPRERGSLFFSAAGWYPYTRVYSSIVSLVSQAGVPYFCVMLHLDSRPTTHPFWAMCLTFRCFYWSVDDEMVQTRNVQKQLFDTENDKIPPLRDIS